MGECDRCPFRGESMELGQYCYHYDLEYPDGAIVMQEWKRGRMSFTHDGRCPKEKEHDDDTVHGTDD